MLPKIAVITLNWNGKHLTDECLHSLLQIDYPEYEIIVVDNGSRDNSFPYLENKYPQVTFIKNKTNRGFAEGNNIGIRHAQKKGICYFFLINNDTIVDKYILQELMTVALKNPKIIIVGPKIYNYYNKNIIESAGGDYSIAKSKNYQIGYGEEDKGQHDKDKQVNFTSGCAMLVKNTIIKDWLFNPSYFAYFEDTDLCHRVLQQGNQIWYAHKAKIWHKVSASTGGYKNPISTYLFTKNRIKFVFSTNNWQKLIFFPYFIGFYIPAFTLYLLTQLRFSHVRSFYRAVFSTIFPFLKHRHFENKNYDCLHIGINARYLQRTITGIERYILETLNHLLKIDRKNNYSLFLSSQRQIPDIIQAPNITFNYTTTNTEARLRRIIWEQLTLGKEILKRKIDIFHGPSFVVPFLKSCKNIITIYDLAFLASPESFTIITRLYFKIFLTPSIYLADHIIAISQATKKDIIKYFKINPEKISIVYGALSPSIKKVINKNILQETKKKYNLPDKYILFTGLISPRKNIVRALHAYARIHIEIPHKFVITGKKGWLYNDVFKTVKKLNLEKKVIFTGYVPDNDLCALYTLSDIFIFPSLYEGFGLPILEAMTCDAPVITSNISSMPEVAGNAALLVNPYNIQEITEAIKKLYTDKKLRQTLIKKGRNQIKKFTWKKSAQETLKIYEKLASS